MSTRSATSRPAAVVVRGAGAWLRHRPVTSALLALLVIAFILVGPWRGPLHQVRWVLGTGFEPVVELGRWWTLVTSLFLVDHPAEVVVALVLVVAVVGTAESLMGSIRTACIFVATGVIGAVVGIGLEALGLRIGELWSHGVIEFTTHDPLTAIAGTATCASAFAPALWRRRLRVITFAVCAALLLYAGQPSDLYRMIGAVAGLIAGIVLHRAKRPATWTRSSHHEVRVLLAAIVAISGVGPFVSLLAGSRFGLLAPLSLLLAANHPGRSDPSQCAIGDVTRGCVRAITLERIDGPGPVLVTIIPLAILLVCAVGILRGRRLAIWIAATVHGAFAVLAAYYFGFLPAAGDPSVVRHTAGHYRETVISLLLSVLVPAAIAVVLIVFRRHVAVLASRATIARFLITVLLALTILVIAALAFAAADPAAFGPAGSLSAVVTDLPERFIPVEFLRREVIGVEPVTIVGRILWGGIGPLFWIIAIAAAFRAVFVRPQSATDEGIIRTRTLLESDGGESIGWMATWPGSRHWFDEGGRAAIAYRVIGSVAVSLGAPVGPDQGDPGVVERFARFADDNGWIPVLYGVDSSRAPDFTRLGWSVLGVAEETVIHPQQWNTAGKKWQDIRSSVSRAERAGITTEWTRWSDLTRGVANQLAEISEQWVADKALPEMGFTLGGMEELRDPAVRLLLAVDSTGRVEAITSWLPWFGTEGQIGWTLDFMRRRPDSINGVMEFLIQNAAVRMRDAGMSLLSLSAAPLARSGGPEPGTPGDRGALDRLLDFLGTSLEPAYGFRSLLKFKRKFQPEFRGVVMAFPDPVALPVIGLALARAYLPTLTLRQASAFVRGR